ncbi:MAG: hypothetical protein JXR71_09765 [Bacteroidales bacterium]|nr:hypothetical protein [Bacteroidales bacterium]
MFSSKFGNGKTTFLKNFFESNPDYNAIHLYPVNYSVARNEDIFELIKYDILFELLATKIDLDESEESLLKIAKDFIITNKEDAVKILTPFLSMIPLIGKGLQGTTEKIIDLTHEFLSHLKNKSKNETDIIVEFLEKFTEEKGSIYEENFYTLLINDLVGRLRSSNDDGNERKTVLVIDDFDRIDPDHVFRILNVFAAHQDLDEKGNKFGFDKVIVVCDIDNIRNIFHHRYGANTDFNGYIDKFFSVDVFHFSIKQEIKNEISSLLDSISGNDSLDGLFNLKRDKNYSFNVVKDLLFVFAEKDLINVRNIVKLRQSKFILQDYLIYSFQTFSNRDFWGICIFNFLKSVFGDYNSLIKAFEKLRTQTIKIDFENEWIISYLLYPIFAIQSKNGILNVTIPLNNMEDQSKLIHLRRSSSQFSGLFYRVDFDNTDDLNWNQTCLNINIFELFYSTIKLAYERNWLQ